MEIYSFPPVAAEGAKRLILGSMPGQASLAAQQYYAHPRNLFWIIAGELVGAYPALEYSARTNILTANGIALWDVLKSCQRPGSLDADIDKASMVCNDFCQFFTDFPHISHVYFNGATAEQTFRKRVLPGLAEKLLTLQRLPSTSPAHAALSFQQKLAAWRVIVEQQNGY